MFHGNRQSLALFRVWRAIGWALVALVIYGSLTPDVPQVGPEGSDKAMHFLAYAVLMAWFCLLYRAPARPWLALVFVLLGAGLELAQAQTGYRYPEFADMLANATGVMIGWLVVLTPLSGSLLWVEARLNLASAQ